MALVAATIRDKDHGTVVECLFNPKEYTLSKSNTWQADQSHGSNLGFYEFSSGQATMLTMELFFDTYSNSKNGASAGSPKDVRKTYTAAIWKMMTVDPSLSSLNGVGQGSDGKKGRPPLVIFQWGATWTFKAVITSLSERFTLFLPDGTPVRSTMSVTFQQIQEKDDYPPTNPTSGGRGGERVWVVNEGDTLAWIAYKSYGNTRFWRQIADANNLTRVRQLKPGMVLEIPNA